MYFKNLNSTLNKFYHFFTNGKDYQYLTFFRICVPLVALADLMSLRHDLPLFFSQKNTIIPQELLYLFSEYYEYLKPLYDTLAEYALTETFYSWSVWIYVACLISLMFGFLSRFSALIALLLQLIIFKSFTVFNFGYDQFLTMSLFYCLIFPVGKIDSIDNRLFRNNGLKHHFDYQKILRIHLGTIYLFAGLAKIISATWWNGEAIWRALSSIYDDLFKIHPAIMAFAGICTIAIETFYPLMVSFKKTRKFTVYSMVLMHILIAVLLDLPMFAGIMIVWNISSYYSYFVKSSQKTILCPESV